MSKKSRKRRRKAATSSAEHMEDRSTNPVTMARWMRFAWVSVILATLVAASVEAGRFTKPRLFPAGLLEAKVLDAKRVDGLNRVTYEFTIPFVNEGLRSGMVSSVDITPANSNAGIVLHVTSIVPVRLAWGETRDVRVVASEIAPDGAHYFRFTFYDSDQNTVVSGSFQQVFTSSSKTSDVSKYKFVQEWR
jgi:hypothetical protein